MTNTTRSVAARWLTTMLLLAAWTSPAPADDGPSAPSKESGEASPHEPVTTVGDQIVVTAGRVEQRVRDVAVKVSVLGRAEIERTPAAAVDELLRQLPSFNLQRPESSRVLNLSGQAVSYRGLGGTSASRSLVLVDGVPLNEPFAGWISWSRVPLATIERIEVVPGGAAGAWGNQALGGVIHLITRRPEPATVVADASYGSRDTIDATVLGSHVRGPVAVSAHASRYDTDGFFSIPEDLRGPADTTNRSKSSVFDARLELVAGGGSLWTLQGTYLDEERAGGDALSTELLELTSLRAGGDFVAPTGGHGQANLFTLLRSASNTRGSISDDRTEVTPRRNQFDNPSTSVGAGVSWTWPWRRQTHQVVTGVDGLWTESEVNEDSGWSDDRFIERIRSGGKQLLGGAFVQDTMAVGDRLRLAGGLRLDLWRSYGGFFFGTDLTDGETLYDHDLADRTKWIVSPNLGARYQASERLSLRGALFQSFRAPTPNELFKSTPSQRSYLAANSSLDPERIDLGVELGFDFEPRRTSQIRLTGFWNEVVDSITEVTVGTAGSVPAVIEPCGELRARGVCTQRRNIDLVRVRGIELEGELRPAPPWRLWASYTWTESKVIESATDRQIEGLWLRRVPEHQAAVQASYDAPRLLSATLQLRYQGERFEDDVNELVIGGAFLADLRLSRRFGPGLELLFDVENLFDEEVEVAKEDDYAELGQPRTLRLGVRYRWQGARGATP